MGQEGVQTENNLNVEELVKNVFIKGNCRNVNNITSIGNEDISMGQFNNGATAININDGIILSTGDIGLAAGPNLQIDASYPFFDESTDPDLSQLASGSLFDVTGIEFDFVPIDDKITFRYVFASEEYCEFVGTQFNDVFGFFVSGPGINGTFDNNAINVANIINLSGINETVSINTINHLTNQNFYVNNITTTDAQNCEIPYNPMFQEFIEYDGFTIALTASFSVVPCETYHIRLVIADVGDANLDSAVFLESKSFDLGEKVTIRAEVPNSTEPIAYEDCVDGEFVFTRNASSNINESCTIEYTISSESEAINGVDFVEIPMSVTIPAGAESFILPITVIEDNIVEGPEVLKLALVYDCDCIDPASTELIINEVEELSLDFEELIVCANQPFSISPAINGGVPPYSFLWETGAQTEVLNVVITTPTQFPVTVTDFCGNTSEVVFNIDIQDIPSAILTGTYDLCATSTTGIPIQFEGIPPWKIEYTIDDIAQDPIDNIQTNPYFIDTPTEGTYELTAFNDAYCEGNVVGSATVESTFEVEIDIVSPSCYNNVDGSINITALDAIPPFSIEWNVETADEYTLQNLSAGTYLLSIINGENCLYEKTFELVANSNDIKDCAPIYIPNIFSPDEDGFNDILTIYYDTSSGVENIISFQIYNRWGSLLFEKNNFASDGTTGWNGDYKGKPVDAGIYVYTINVAFEDGSSLLLNGDVMVLR